MKDIWRIAAFTVGTFWMMQSGSFGQCQKRVIVYIDNSGSMFSSSRNTETPHDKTVGSLSGFLNSQDGRLTFEGYTFGSDVSAGQKVEQNQMQGLITYLNSQHRANETNLIAVLEHTINTIKTETYAGQVVIIASDFAHEPRDGMPTEEANADWTNRFNHLRASLQSVFHPGGGTVLVLFKAPLLGSPRLVERNRALQTPVLNALKELAGAGNLIDLETSNSQETLTSIIRQNLTLKPVAITRLVGTEHDQRIAVDIKNNDCIPITIASLEAYCKVDSLSTSRLPISILDSKPLEPNIVRAFRSEPVPMDKCWTGNSFGVAGKLLNGIEFSSLSGSTLKMNGAPTVRLITPPYPFISPFLTITMDLSGAYMGPRDVHLKLNLAEQKRALADGRLSVPPDISDKSQQYLLLADADPRITESIRDGDKMELQLDDVEGGTQSPTLLKDDFIHLFTLTFPQIIPATISMVALIFYVLQKRQGPFMSKLFRVLGWLASTTFIISCLMMYGNRVIIKYVGSFSSMETIELIFAAFTVTVLVFYGSHVNWINRLSNRVEKGQYGSIKEFEAQIWRWYRSLMLPLITIIIFIAASIYGIALSPGGFARLLDFH